MEQIAIFFIVTAVVLLAAYAYQQNVYQQNVYQQKSLAKQGNIPDCVKWVADVLDKGKRVWFYRATRSF
jgi:hypothetical protein